MNRIFHARVVWYQYLYVLLLGAVAFAALWLKNGWLAAIVMLLLIGCIERIIHTSYTISTEDKLIISYGRFARKLVIPITRIKQIEKSGSMKFGKFHITDYVLINYDEKYVAVMPVKEREFVELIIKRSRLD